MPGWVRHHCGAKIGSHGLWALDGRSSPLSESSLESLLQETTGSGRGAQRAYGAGRRRQSEGGEPQLMGTKPATRTHELSLPYP